MPDLVPIRYGRMVASPFAYFRGAAAPMAWDLAHAPTSNILQLDYYGRLCGWALARAHPRTGRATVISGYLGMSEDFDHAIADFAIAYAGQNGQDYRRLLEEISAGHVLATLDQ